VIFVNGDAMSELDRLNVPEKCNGFGRAHFAGGHGRAIGQPE
jgi:hypothetical protein